MGDSAKNIIKAFLGLVLTVLLTAGCGIIQRHVEVQPWVGRPVVELVQQRGQPTRIERDGRGNRVFVYEWTTEYSSEVPGRVWRDAAGAVRWTNPTTETRYHCERQRYYVSPQDTIVDATWPIW